jgi:excisionase family DNA binding protein
VTEVCTTARPTTSPDVAIRQLGEYLTIAEAAKLLRRRIYALYLAIHNGELRACQPCNEGAWLIHPADLLAFVERSSDAPKRPDQGDETGGTLRERLARASMAERS